MKHPGQTFKEKYLDPIGIDYECAANIMGFERSQLVKVLSGESSITKALAAKMENDFGGSRDLWVKMQREYDENNI